MSKLMRKGTQRKVTRIAGIPAETNFSVFEDFTPGSYVTAADMQDGSFSELGNYSGVNATSKDGNEEVKKFRSAVISKRLALDDAEFTEDHTPSFSIYLAYNDEATLDNKRVVCIKFTKEVKDNTEIIKAMLSVKSTEGKIYAVKDLSVDSDDEEGLIRLTMGGNWNSKTYAILDFNKNLCIDKYIYLTMNVPFATNMGWLEPFRKRIYSYYIKDEIQGN